MWYYYFSVYSVLFFLQVLFPPFSLPLPNLFTRNNWSLNRMHLTYKPLHLTLEKGEKEKNENGISYPQELRTGMPIVQKSNVWKEWWYLFSMLEFLQWEELAKEEFDSSGMSWSLHFLCVSIHSVFTYRFYLFHAGFPSYSRGLKFWTSRILSFASYELVWIGKRLLCQEEERNLRLNEV